MRKVAVALALCVVGCQFSVGPVPTGDPGGGMPPANGGMQPAQPASPALDGGAAGDGATDDAGKNEPGTTPQMTPTPPAPSDCRTDGCPWFQSCVQHHGAWSCAGFGGD